MGRLRAVSHAVVRVPCLLLDVQTDGSLAFLIPTFTVVRRSQSGAVIGVGWGTGGEVETPMPGTFRHMDRIELRVRRGVHKGSWNRDCLGWGDRQEQTGEEERGAGDERDQTKAECHRGSAARVGCDGRGRDGEGCHACSLRSPTLARIGRVLHFRGAGGQTGIGKIP
jgi:hypothetical protein